MRKENIRNAEKIDGDKSPIQFWADKKLKDEFFAACYPVPATRVLRELMRQYLEQVAPVYGEPEGELQK